MNSNETSALVSEYRRSPFAKIWHKVWRVFPSFSRKHSPFFLFEDGTVLWNQGFGNIAYLKGDRSLTISWSLQSDTPASRVIHIDNVLWWHPPHEKEQLTEKEIIDLREKLMDRFRIRGETVIYR